MTFSLTNDCSNDEPAQLVPLTADQLAEIAAANAAALANQSYTFLQFMALFTPAEQAAIVSSADVQVKLFVMMATGAGTLQLNNPEVAQGVGYLASLAILTPTRATEVLAGQAPS